MDKAARDRLDQLEKKIARLVAQAQFGYHLIETGDRVMACVSGGKDSLTMLYFLDRMRRIAPIDFDLLAFYLDQGFPTNVTRQVEDYLKSTGIPYVIHKRDIYAVVTEKLEPGDTRCSLCSRLRRGIIYDQAVELGCNKIALGHHRDDLLETLLLNILFVGQLKSMPPYLVSDDGRNIVIRPLAFVPEELTVEFAQLQRITTVKCTDCGQGDDFMRNQMKQLLGDLQARYGVVKGSLLTAMMNVQPTHLLDRSIQRVPETGLP